MTASPLRKWWHSAARARRRGLALLPPVQLPFPEDAAKARADRYVRLLSALASNCEKVVAVAREGALTREEALQAIERHLQRFQYDLASERKAVQP